MRNLTFLSLLLCSTALASTALADQPLTFGRYAGSGGVGRTRGELYEVLECALSRWRAATCLPIDMSLVPAHFTRWATVAESVDASAHAWGPWDSTRIRLSPVLNTEVECPVLVHEIGHVLRRNYGHTSADGSMSFPVVHVYSSPVSKITQHDIDLVCAAQPCQCEVPE